MARYDRLTVYNRILASGLVPLFYHDRPEVACQVAVATSEGGAQVLEFTNRGDHALQVFGELRQTIEQSGLPLILGVGTVIDAPTAAIFIAAGANFVIGPSFNPEVARLCNRRKIAYLPGCATATEISEAEELGAEIIKVNPASCVGGPTFIKEILAPMPWSRLMPSGGVEPTRENLVPWFKAGAACVAMGSKLIRKDLLAAGDYAGLRDATANALAIVKEARA